MTTEYRIKYTTVPESAVATGTAEAQFRYRDLGDCDEEAAEHIWKTERAEFLAAKGRYDALGRFQTSRVELEVRQVGGWEVEEVVTMEVPS
jgi:hypothetical protein